MQEKHLQNKHLQLANFKSQKAFDKFKVIINELEILSNVIKFDAKPESLKEVRDRYKKSKKNQLESIENYYLNNPQQKEIDKAIIRLHSFKVDLFIQEFNSMLSKIRHLESKLSDVLNETKTTKENLSVVSSNELHETKKITENKSIRISGKEAWRYYCKNEKIPNGQYNCTWQNVEFGEGFIKVKINTQNLNIPESNSKKSYNFIKEKYINSNTPLLLVNIRNGRGEITNRDILTYHIHLFKITGEFQFKIQNSLPIDVKGFGYTHEYFRKNFPNYFRNDCFNYLCQICDADQKIFPLGERVIGSNGTEEIKESFLFPYLLKNNHYVIWESTSDSRATYIFEFSITDNIALNRLCSFITGETINKRETLRRSYQLQRQLHLVKIVQHDDYSLWRNGLARIW